jgi:hypothetical protein
MHPLVALALSTPIWGLSLHAPMALASVAPPPIAQVEDVEAPVIPADAFAHGAAYDRTTMDLTRAFQLGATVAMAGTNVLGLIQFGDEYGFHRDLTDTACATHDAVLDDCGQATPVAHLVAAGGTAGLGVAAFVFSTQIDYDVASRFDGDWRTYEVTRWLGLGMNALQAVFGFFLANAIRFGWADPQRDFDVLQGFAIGHAALGIATLGVETYNTALLF